MARTTDGIPGPPRRTPWVRLLPLLALLALQAPTQARAQPADTGILSVLGLWETKEHDGVFQITSCGTQVCGRLVGMRYTGEVPKGKDGESECGLLMLTGFTPDPDDPGRWNGHILDPDDEHVYHAQIWSPREGVLKLRGYVGIPLFGETQTWTRYAGTIGPLCRMP
ncbi:DUF2147 domain-containing protein [Nguyenibacter sp. L1]|uniref:DUF2147 domain-containing protein n=1 Tax=Nguyenibacter sp. L1 TaxID=3049350 RepID=UPI002B467869|nr:DUF2147 domain-containing protein [Nguyenibacter sp. L1]WRH88234.1 DUF2147 domain-containing protein [Nguyenibacter sp. L1]